MAELVQMYNFAPHATLTRFGPSFPVSPALVDGDKDLEDYIMRRISQENMLVRREQGFDLPVGTKVLAYNDISPMDKRRSSTRPEAFEVVAFNNGIYEVVGTSTKTKLSLPRWKLRPL
jgi:hypothetical protein